MSHRDQLVLLPPNRVWRTYPGGATLDRIAGEAEPTDSHLAEDWIGSITRSVIPGREAHYEGVSQVRVGEQIHDFKTLIASDPDYFLGNDHVAKHGQSLLLLVKFLDSAIRLNFQCHPSRDFARRFLDSPSGKTEAYHILGVREGVSDPFIYMGFQNPPTPEQLKHWIETQDIAAMEGCFEKIAIKPGDTYLIPGGLPHALGQGVFMVEIQEPTDFAVRYEFERAGYLLPEAARFMGKGIDFGLSMIDFTAYPLATVEDRFHCSPFARQELGPGSWQETLIGAEQTPCFRVAKTHLHGAVTKEEDTFFIAIVTAGSLDVRIGGRIHRLQTYDKFFCPAGLGTLELVPDGAAEILECFPPS